MLNEHHCLTDEEDALVHDLLPRFNNAELPYVEFRTTEVVYLDGPFTMEDLMLIVGTLHRLKERS